MYRHQGIQALPVELLALSFDYLSICELVTASHVSHFWRTVAWRHRNFWRSVRLAALSTSALELFHARLQAGSGRSALVDISISEASETEFPERLRSVVFPAISLNLHRIDKLYLRFGISFDVDLFRALHHPAPRLDTLDLVLCHETRSSSALPANLFACHAPNLRHVRILNVQLSANRLPLAFWDVADLRYSFNQAQSFPTALFQHWKRLQSLTINGRWCTVSRDDASPVAIDDLQLKSVEVAVFAGSFDLIRHIPCATVASITVPLSDGLSAPLLLEHLRGRLDLQLHHTPDNVYVQYTSRETGMQRAFGCAHSQVDLACLPPALIAHSLVSRIASISCTSTCVPLLAAYGELQSCMRLELSVTADEPLRPLSRPLSLPALECVEISSAVAMRMRPAEILSFLESALRPTSRPVLVTLVGVELDGELSELGERFTTSQSTRPGKNEAVQQENALPAPAVVESEPATRPSTILQVASAARSRPVGLGSR